MDQTLTLSAIVTSQNEKTTLLGKTKQEYVFPPKPLVLWLSSADFVLAMLPS